MKSLLRGGALVFGATLVWQFSNFGFNIVGAHELGPEKYGILASAMGLSYLLNPVVLAVQTVASRQSTSIVADDHGSQLRAIVNYYLLKVGLVGLGVAGVVIVLSPLISRALHLNSVRLVIIFGLVIPTMAANGIVRGVHQGTRRFERYSLGTLTEGLSKICCAVALLTLVWKTPTSGMLALLISSMAALMVNALLLKHWPRPTWSVRVNRHPIRYSMTTFTAFGLLAILLSVDTMTARSTLPSHAAGMYAGISLVGKIVYFATTALTAFLFPVFSARFDQGMGTRRWLGMSMMAVALMSAAVIAVFAWAPYLVTTVLLGSKYRSAAHYIYIMGAIFSIYAMTNLLVMYLLARRQRGISIALAFAAIVQAAGFIVFHGSVTDLMGVMAVAFAVAFIGCAALALFGLAWTGEEVNAVGVELAGDIVIRGIHRAQSRRQGGPKGRHRRYVGDVQAEPSETGSRHGGQLRVG